MTHAFKLSTLALIAHLALAGTAAAGTAHSGLDKAGFDPAVRVQDDLFRAANGGWLQRTEIPADKPEYGAFIQLRDQSDKQVRAIVDALAAKPQKAGSVEHKVGAFYGSFLDTAAIDKLGLKPVLPQLAAIDALKITDELAAWMGQMQGRLASPVLLWVMADFKNPTLNHALTWQGGLGLPDRDYYLKKDDERLAKARAAYEAYLVTLGRLAGLKDPADAARRVLAIEQRIAEVHWDKVDNRDMVKIYNPMTVAELEKAAPGIAWRTYLAAAQLGSVERLVGVAAERRGRHREAVCRAAAGRLAAVLQAAQPGRRRAGAAGRLP